jgi:hypothetical protein
MGRDCVEFRVTAMLSRHNSEQDRIDDTRWEELQERVRAICMEHRYASIAADVA